MAELYMLLGEIKQSVQNMHAMLTENRADNTALTKRVASLERSRTWSKAWIAGAMFVASGSFAAMMFVYKLLSGKP